MLTVEEIQKALHASRAVPLPPGDYHGPLGLEHLAAIVARAGGPGDPTSGDRVRRVIELDAKTWEKLDRLARSAGQSPTSGRASARLSHSRPSAWYPRIRQKLPVSPAIASAGPVSECAMENSSAARMLSCSRAVRSSQNLNCGP